MKLTLTVLALLTASSFGVFGQGQINANDGTAVGVFLTVSDYYYNNGAIYKVGTPAVTAGYPNADVGPGKVTITLYAAPNGTSLLALENSTPIVTVSNSSSTLAGAQGTFSAGSALELTTATQQGTTGGVVVAGWNGTSPLEFIYYAYSGLGNYFGWSAEATGIVAATGINTPTPIFGTGAGQINTFNMIYAGPEPTTLTLGGLGALALMMMRRKKQV